MMFSLQKRLVRDRAAGLAFRWRRTSKVAVANFFLALVITLLAMSFLLFGLRVEGPKVRERVVSKPAKVFYIPMDHPQLQALSQFASAVPWRWEPLDESSEVNAYYTQLNSALTPIVPRQLELLEPPLLVENVRIPKVSGRSEFLPETPEANFRDKLSPKEVSKYTLSFQFEEESLNKRLIVNRDDLVEIDPKYRGSIMNYIIVVNDEGRVDFCNPFGDEKIQIAENWLRSFQFIPSEEGEVVSKVILSVDKVK